MLGLPTGTGKIIFIDDEEIQAGTMEAMLGRLGYRVTVETDSRNALEIFRAQPDAFDLVITDQVMPYLAGHRLAQEMLALRPDIPILICTGFSETIDEEKAAPLGIKDCILKPFNMEDISQVIRKVLPKNTGQIRE